MNVVYLQEKETKKHSNKLLSIKNYCNSKGINLFSPEHTTPYHMLLSTYDFLEKNKDEKTILVGYSIGGLLTLLLNQELHIPCMLINPILHPGTELENQSSIYVRQSDIDELRSIQMDLFSLKNKNIHLFLSLNDRVVNSRKLIKELEGSSIPIYTYSIGGHLCSHFQNILQEKIFPLISYYIVPPK